MRRIPWIAIGMLGALGLLLAFQRMQVEINGKATTDFLVSGGKVYVSVAALREAGAVVTTQPDQVSIQFDPLRGRRQGDMIEGRLGEWLSNGTWRVRVSKVEPATNPFFGKGKGYALTLEIRNLTTQTISFFQSGFDKMILLDENDHKMTFAASSFSKQYDSIARADGFTARVLFGDNHNSNAEVGEADKLLIQFRSTGGKPELKGFRIFLREPSEAKTTRP